MKGQDWCSSREEVATDKVVAQEEEQPTAVAKAKEPRLALMQVGEVETPPQEQREKIVQEIVITTTVANKDTGRENAHTYQTSNKIAAYGNISRR